MDTEIERHHNDEGGGSYSLLLEGRQIGELDYRDVDGRRVFTHTGVRGRYEGHGLAARLVEQGLADAVAEGFEVVPQCGYVARYIQLHPGSET